MTHISAFNLRLEKPKQSLGRTMADMRSWLDNRKIDLVEFRVGPTEAGVAYDIRFRSEDEASRFEQAFA